MISLNKCTGNCISYLLKDVFQKKRKDVNVKELTEHDRTYLQWQNIFPVIVSANWSIQNVIQNKSGIIKHVIVNVKIIVSAKTIIPGILA